MTFPQIFHGVSVLDFSRLLPGPFASTLLRRMGAEVTCIVPPSSDAVLGDYSPFVSLREGKRFLKLDLKSEADLKQAQDLIARSQILLEGFRPGAMARLGLGFNRAQDMNPSLLYVSLVGYRPEHPKYLLGAHDLNFLVDSGVYSLLFGESHAGLPALQLADLVGGFYGTFRILAEWIQRGSRPQASHLEVPVMEGLELFGEYLRHESAPALLALLTGSLARYRIYFTKDQQRIAVAALEPKFYENLLQALQLETRSGAGEEDMAQRIQAAFAKRDLAEWREIFLKVDACVSFIPSQAEVLRSKT